MSDSIITVRDLGKTYGKGLFKKGSRAIDEVSLEVGRGQVFGLLGPNGAGKTTLIKILLGLVRVTSGEARVFGRRAGDPVSRRRVGYLPEAHRLPQYLTGEQVLRLYGMYSGRTAEWLNERLPHWIERVGMKGSAKRKIREYSKGMTQRIGLAQALIHEPELVFLDEPTDGVDPVGRKVIRGIVKELKDAGVTVFINSHLLMEVEMICDRVVIMDKGRIVREGTIEELTPETGLVRFTIAPVPHDLPRLLEGLVPEVAVENDLFDPALAVEKGSFDVALDDEGIGQVIDRLRSRGVAIRSIVPSKLTLEDAFIDMFKSGEDQR